LRVKFCANFSMEYFMASRLWNKREQKEGDANKTVSERLTGRVGAKKEETFLAEATNL